MASLSDSLTALLNQMVGRKARKSPVTQTNTAGVTQPEYAESDAPPTPLTTVHHPDGRVSRIHPHRDGTIGWNGMVHSGPKRCRADIRWYPQFVLTVKVPVDCSRMSIKRPSKLENLKETRCTLVVAAATAPRVLQRTIKSMTQSVFYIP